MFISEDYYLKARVGGGFSLSRRGFALYGAWSPSLSRSEAAETRGCAEFLE